MRVCGSCYARRDERVYTFPHSRQEFALAELLISRPLESAVSSRRSKRGTFRLLRFLCFLFALLNKIFKGACRLSPHHPCACKRCPWGDHTRVVSSVYDSRSTPRRTRFNL